MQRSKQLVIIIVLLIARVSCISQSNTINQGQYKRCPVKTINFEQGLMNNETNSITTFRSGFTWVSTKTGMQRFNGYTMENINPVVGLDTIAIDYPVVFFALQNGHIWISYDQGILEYDPVNNIFQKAINISNNKKRYLPVIPLVQNNSGIWCMYEKKGIVVYDAAKKIIQPFGNAETGFVDSIMLKTPLFTRNAASNGHDIFLSNTKRILHINTINRQFGYLQNDLGDVIGMECNKTNLYVTAVKGIFYIDIQNLLIKKLIAYKDIVPESVFSAQVCLAANNQLLVSVNRHLYEFDTACVYRKEFTLLNGDPVVANGQIHLIYTDRFRRIWLMTNDDIKLVQNIEIPFGHFIYRNSKNNFIKCIYYDEQKELLLAGCFNGGIQLYDTSGNHLWEKPLATEQVKDIMTIEKLTANEYLIETYFRGWFLLNLPSKKISPFPVPSSIENVLHTNTISWTNNVQRINDSSVFISTQHNIYNCVFQHTTLRSATPLLPFLQNTKDQFDCFIYTSTNTLWAGTSGGTVFLLDNKGNIKTINTPGNFGIRSCMEDAMHNIWIGTDKGLCIYTAAGQLIKKLTRETGLLNDCIYAILPVADQAAVFISTNFGLSYISLNGTIKNYSKELGLQENEFNNGAACKTAGGKFYFGGVNGITGFYPSSLYAIRDTPVVNITRLVVNDSLYTASTGMWNSNSIRLNYDQNHIQLDIAANGLLNTDEYIYTYRLKDIEESWQTTRQPTGIRYTLDPGNYVFEINCSPYLSSNTVFSKRISIIIHPPWWRTWWFRILAVICMAFIIAWIVWQYNRRAYRKKINALQVQQEVQQERERISRDLHDNLGAHVAAIAANVTRIEEANALDQTEASQAIHELQSNSQSIITQLHDTIWALNRRSISLTAISDRFKVFLQKIRPSYPGIDISVKESIENDIALSPANALHLFRIMQEAVNNAVRHSHCCHIVIAFESALNWSVDIIDDGSGIVGSTDPASGNGLRNMRQRATEAGWEIKWVSENPKGTRLTITPKI